MLKDAVVLPTLDTDGDKVCEPPHVSSSDARTLQVSSSDESDGAWLASLCRARRRTLHPTLSDESDDAWMTSLCQSSVSNRTAGNFVPLARASNSISFPHAADEREQSGRANSLHRRVTPHLGGPWSSLESLVNDLIAVGTPPLPRWPMPAQDALLKCGVTAESSWPLVQKCLWRFATWSMSLGVCAYKVGIAHDTSARWVMYRDEEMWLFMDVMHEGNPEECRLLEMELIGKVGKISGCYNILGGGEGIRAGNFEGKCSCYVVYATAGEGIGVRAAWIARNRERAR